MKTWVFERCVAVRTIDGDSCVLSIDTGFNHSALVHVRLLGVDTCERGRDPVKWEAAKSFTEGWLHSTMDNIIFECAGHDKYGGRWLGTIKRHNGDCLNTALLDAGLAVKYDGGLKMEQAGL